jgi:hypothetical protein
VSAISGSGSQLQAESRFRGSSFSKLFEIAECTIQQP